MRTHSRCDSFAPTRCSSSFAVPTVHLSQCPWRAATASTRPTQRSANEKVCVHLPFALHSPSSCTTPAFLSPQQPHISLAPHLPFPHPAADHRFDALQRGVDMVCFFPLSCSPALLGCTMAIILTLNSPPSTAFPCNKNARTTLVTPPTPSSPPQRSVFCKQARHRPAN